MTPVDLTGVTVILWFDTWAHTHGPGRLGHPLRLNVAPRPRPIPYSGGMPRDRITINPDQMGGLPCIRGLRIPVSTVLGQLAAGRTREEILADFPDLEPEDIDAALGFAAEAVQERELPLVNEA